MFRGIWLYFGWKYALQGNTFATDVYDTAWQGQFSFVVENWMQKDKMIIYILTHIDTPTLIFFTKDK